MARQPDLQAFNAGVRRALKERARPFDPGEVSRPSLPLVEYLDERGVKAAWRAVAGLLKAQPDLYNRFVVERDLRDLMVEVTAAHDGAIDFPALVAEIERRIVDQSQWLVAVPLANLMVLAALLK